MKNRTQDIKTLCIFCKEEKKITVNEDDYQRWARGTKAQEAFPYLNPDERELLISGTCRECWEKHIR
jgi:hypothetical protein